MLEELLDWSQSKTFLFLVTASRVPMQPLAGASSPWEWSRIPCIPLSTPLVRTISCPAVALFAVRT